MFLFSKFRKYIHVIRNRNVFRFTQYHLNLYIYIYMVKEEELKLVLIKVIKSKNLDLYVISAIETDI